MTESVAHKPLALADLEHLSELLAGGMSDGHILFVSGIGLRRLVAEIVRLSSDEWLEIAAGEIAGWVNEWDGPIDADETERLGRVGANILAILRENRDGKA